MKEIWEISLPLGLRNTPFLADRIKNTDCCIKSCGFVYSEFWFHVFMMSPAKMPGRDVSASCGSVPFLDAAARLSSISLPVSLCFPWAISATSWLVFRPLAPFFPRTPSNCQSYLSDIDWPLNEWWIIYNPNSQYNKYSLLWRFPITTEQIQTRHACCFQHVSSSATAPIMSTLLVTGTLNPHPCFSTLYALVSDQSVPSSLVAVLPVVSLRRFV